MRLSRRRHIRLVIGACLTGLGLISATPLTAANSVPTDAVGIRQGAAVSRNEALPVSMPVDALARRAGSAADRAQVAADQSNQAAEQAREAVEQSDSVSSAVALALDEELAVQVSELAAQAEIAAEDAQEQAGEAEDLAEAGRQASALTALAAAETATLTAEQLADEAMEMAALGAGYIPPVVDLMTG